MSLGEHDVDTLVEAAIVVSISRWWTKHAKLDLSSTHNADMLAQRRWRWRDLLLSRVLPKDEETLASIGHRWRRSPERVRQEQSELLRCLRRAPPVHALAHRHYKLHRILYATRLPSDGDHASLRVCEEPVSA